MFIKQSYGRIEIIIVNDGSTDKSMDIAEKFALLDERIVIYSKQNGGLASARNYGVLKSSGNYIIFVDSDDYISYDHVANLYSTLIKYNADIAISKMQKVDVNGKSIGLSYKDTGESFAFSKLESLKSLLLQSKFDNSASAKIYKRSICEVHPFPEGKLYEDFATVYKIFLAAEKVVYIDSSDYFYVQRPFSIINSEFNEKKLDLIQFTREMICDEKLKELNFSEYAKVRSFAALVNLWRSVPLENKNSTLIWNELIQYRTSAISVTGAKAKIKIGAILSYFGRKLSYLILSK